MWADCKHVLEVLFLNEGWTSTEKKPKVIELTFQND
jgi:hypothetical protein